MEQKTIKHIAEGFGLVASVIVGWLFISAQFVSAADYQKDRLDLQATMLSIQLDYVEDRLDRAIARRDVDQIKKIEHHRGQLERQQVIIMEKQLDN